MGFQEEMYHCAKVNVHSVDWTVQPRDIFIMSLWNGQARIERRRLVRLIDDLYAPNDWCTIPQWEQFAQCSS